MMLELPVQGIRDRFLMLSAMPFFSHLDDAILLTLAEHVRRTSFKSGDVLLEEGSLPPACYIVLSGVVKVTRQGQHVARVERPYGVGFLSTLARDSNGVHAVAVEDTVTLELPTRVLVRVIEENFSFVRWSLSRAAENLLMTRSQLPASPGSPPATDPGEWKERPATMVERILDTWNQGIFMQTNLDAVIELVRRMDERRLKPGHVLWRQGDPATFTTRLEYGLVRCANDDGEVVVGAPYVLGSLDALAQVPRGYTAITVTKAQVLQWDRSAFLSVLETHIDLAMALLAVISEGVIHARAERGRPVE